MYRRGKDREKRIDREKIRESFNNNGCKNKFKIFNVQIFFTFLE
jgi:hypothetical protein